MPTIPQFVEFLKYLRANPTAENTKVYNEITEARGPLRVEHLDAYFDAKCDELWVASNHIVGGNGEVVAQEIERLEGHLMKDKDPGISLEHWLNNPTKQGLPQENSGQGDLDYWHPKDRAVARFYADSVRAGLDCNGNPGYSGSVRGVFACAENLGGKQ